MPVHSIVQIDFQQVEHGIVQKIRFHTKGLEVGEYLREDLLTCANNKLIMLMIQTKMMKTIINKDECNN